MPAELERHVQSIVSALKVLDAFDGDEALTLSALHERTVLTRSRILRTAGTLIAHGFLEYNENAKTYRLGLKLFRIGRMLDARFSSLSDFVRPSLSRLAEESGNTAFYSVVQGFARLVAAKAESREGIRFFVEEGECRPLHRGATGKLLLAYARPDVVDRFLEQLSNTDPAFDPSKMTLELENIRSDGFAVSRGEVTPFGFAVAAPVAIKRDGELHHDAITIAGPLAKLNSTLVRSYRDMLAREAKHIEGN